MPESILLFDSPYFFHQLQTEGGWVVLSANVRVVRRTLILDELAIDPLHAKTVLAGTSVFFLLRQELGRQARLEGYTVLEITGVRHSGRHPNRAFHYRWRLS